MQALTRMAIVKIAFLNCMAVVLTKRCDFLEVELIERLRTGWINLKECRIALVFYSGNVHGICILSLCWRRDRER